MEIKRYLIAMDPGKKQDPATIQVYKAMPTLINPDPLLAEPGRIIIHDDLVMQYSIQEKRYTDLVAFLYDLMNRRSLKDNSVLVFDATGVGEAVKDMLHDRHVRSMVPIVYTSGGRVTPVYQDGGDRRFGSQAMALKILEEIHVPKNDMVDAARIAMEQHQVRVVPGVPGTEDFHTQLREFTGRMTSKGYMTYNNSSDDVHDDKVNCFMMRCWYRRYLGEQYLRMYDSSADDQETVSII